MKPNIRKGMLAIGTWGLLLLASGCIGTTEPARFYSLSPAQSPETAARMAIDSKNMSIGLGPIEFPEYLNRPQIVTRSHPNELMFSEYRRWAEPLSENFAQTLSENLSRELGTDNVFVYPWPPQVDVTWQVLIDVNRFEGKLGDEVHLIARWVVIDGKENRVRLVRKSRITEPVEKGKHNRFNALIAAESRAVATLGEEISTAIRRLQGER